MAISGPWAHAARPFVTDDARVVGRGGCQIETFYKEQRAYSGSGFWFLPACNPLPNKVQIDSTVGHQNGEPPERFYTVGLRLLF